MSKLLCSCGHIIVDQTDALKYKGEIIPDVSQDFLCEKMDGIIDSLIDAIKSDQREKWINDNFRDSYPHDLKNSSMVSDFFLRYYMEKTKDIYQCEKCGRILIQIGKTQRFSSFKPESDNWRDILGGNELTDDDQ